MDASGSARFVWNDGERTIYFGRGALDAALGELGRGYTVLATQRGFEAAPQLDAYAGDAFEVPPGDVDEIATAMVGLVGPGTLIVALGGGHVIDTAKALAAARKPGRRPRVAAVPTTLSGAEMTALHPRAAGADGSLPGARPKLVINDPSLSASQPPAELAAGAACALAHAVESAATVLAHPVASLTAGEAMRLVAGAYSAGGEGEPNRDALALAALLAGYARDSTGYGMHGVLTQTLAAGAGIGYGVASAAMLPHTLRALELRGVLDGDEIVALATDLARRAGALSLRALGVDDATLDACADAAANRAELDAVPPRPERDELRALYAAAAAA